MTAESAAPWPQPFRAFRLATDPDVRSVKGAATAAPWLGPRSGQESRSVTARPGLALQWRAGMAPGPDRQERKPHNARGESQHRVRRLQRPGARRDEKARRRAA